MVSAVPQSESKPEPKTEANLPGESKPLIQAKTEPKPQIETKTEPKPQTETKSESRPVQTKPAQLQAEAKAEVKPQAEKPNAKPQAEVPAVARPQIQPKAETSTKPSVASPTKPSVASPTKPSVASPTPEPARTSALEQAQMGRIPAADASSTKSTSGVSEPKAESAVASKPANPTLESSTEVSPQRKATATTKSATAESEKGQGEGKPSKPTTIDVGPTKAAEPKPTASTEVSTKAGDGNSKDAVSSKEAKAPVPEPLKPQPKEEAKPPEPLKPQPVETAKPQPVETAKPQPKEQTKPVEPVKPVIAATQPQAEANQLSNQAKVGKDSLECAVVVDARGLNPPLSPSPSPAVLDPSGRKVWPNTDAVKGISSDLVDRTSIALFFQNPSEIQADEYTNVLRLKAQSTKPSEFATQSRFNDYAVVSGADAGRLESAGLACQMIFLR
jgi:hypothetical protein